MHLMQTHLGGKVDEEVERRSSGSGTLLKIYGATKVMDMVHPVCIRVIVEVLTYRGDLHPCRS